jgi:hypothetical protein
VGSSGKQHIGIDKAPQETDQTTVQLEGIRGRKVLGCFAPPERVHLSPDNQRDGRLGVGAKHASFHLPFCL